MANDGTTGLTEVQCPLTQTLQYYNDIKNTWHDYTCTDTDGAAVGTNALGCSYYTANPSECNDLNDSDFNAGSMCCACGGGDTCTDIDFGAYDSAGKNCADYSIDDTLTCGASDTASFVAADMCCACLGGKKYITGDQVKPVDATPEVIHSCTYHSVDGTNTANCMY